MGGTRMKRLTGILLLSLSLLGCARGENLFTGCGLSLSLPKGFEVWTLPQGNGRYGASLLLLGADAAVELWVDKGPVIGCALYAQEEQAGFNALARVMPRAALHLPGTSDKPSKKDLQTAVALGESPPAYTGTLPPDVQPRALGKSAQLAAGGQRLVKKGSVSLRRGEGFTLVPEYSLLILTNYRGPRIAAQSIPSLTVWLAGENRIEAQRAAGSDLKGLVETVAAFSVIGGDASFMGDGSLSLGGDCDCGLYIAQAKTQKKAGSCRLMLGGSLRLESQGLLWGVYAAGNASRGQEGRVLIQGDAQVLAEGETGLFAYTELAVAGSASLTAQGIGAGVLLPAGAALTLRERGVLEALSAQGAALRLPRPLALKNLSAALGSSRETAQPAQSLSWVGFDYDNGDMGAQTPCQYLRLAADANE